MGGSTSGDEAPATAEENDGPDGSGRAGLRYRQSAVDANASFDQLGEPLHIPRKRVVRSLLGALARAAGRVGLSATAIARRGRKVPFVPQIELADCGAACLAMVFAYHRVEFDMSRIRAMTGANRDGVTARAIVTAARSLGLRARGVRSPLDGLVNLPTPAILHWNLNHFVVLESCGRNGSVTIVDPALGRREVERDDVDRAFTGVALLFEGIDRDAPSAGSRTSPWSLLSGMTRPRRRWVMVLALSLLLQLAAIAVPLATRVVVDRAVPNQDYTVLRVLALVAIPFLFLFVVVSALRASALVILQAHLDFSLVTRLTSHLFELPYAFFQSRSAGDLFMRLRSSSVVRELFTSTTVSGLLDGTMVLGSLAVILVVDWPVGLVVLGLAVVQTTVLVAAWTPYQSLTTEMLEAQSRSYGVMMEMLAGVETLKIAGAASRGAERWSNFFAREVNVEIRRGNLDAVSDSLVTGVRTIAPLVVLLYGTHRLLDGSMSLGTLLAIVTLGAAFLNPVASLVTTVLRFSVVYGYLQRMQDILATPRERDLGHATPLDRFTGTVVVDRVSHRYGPTSPLVLEDISLTVKPGASLGIVGASGSGKSTLAMIVAGLHVPAVGRVLYDGQDLAVTDLDTVRRQIAVVSQQSYVFAGTIRSNITLGDDDVPLSEIEDAARAACIHDEIVAMPMGYDTIVSDGGTTVSGGQRQRIALARTFLRHPVLLVLDEATSALDSVVEARIFAHVRERGLTRIVVAHRLSTVADSDVIVVMHAGRAVEMGNHHELLARDGRYAELVRAQR
ncbi:MAG TPA: peptidase domain-containing ABC transporter [Acidimicrobiales bacterium]